MLEVGVPPRVSFVDLAEPAESATKTATLAHGTALVIGNFDGVHTGHAAVLAQMGGLAAARGLVPAVLTFEPHPAVVLGRTAPPLLTTLARKVALFGRHGVREVFVARFTTTFASTSPERFLEELVFGRLAARVVVVGDNFRFGKARVGDFTALDHAARARHHEAFASILASDTDGPISSTRVRALVAAGEVGEAQRLLGRPHALSGVVVLGAQKGRTIGFPTANLAELPELLPANGVYAVSVDRLERSFVEGESLPDRPRALAHGVMNIGTRPTVSGGDTTRHVEVHLHDFAGDLYGCALRVHLLARVRDERRFPSFEALRAQITLDSDAARALTCAIPIPSDAPFA